MGTRTSVARELRAELSKTIRDVVLLVVENLIASTPVDTTNAANNWMVTTRSPYTGVDGSRLAPSDTVERMLIDAFRSYDVGADGAVYVRNNVDYVKYLDEGWSQQADADFVEAAVMAAERLAPTGRQGAVKHMLRSLATQAITRRGEPDRSAAIARNRGTP